MMIIIKFLLLLLWVVQDKKPPRNRSLSTGVDNKDREVKKGAMIGPIYRWQKAENGQKFVKEIQSNQENGMAFAPFVQAMESLISSPLSFSATTTTTRIISRLPQLSSDTHIFYLRGFFDCLDFTLHLFSLIAFLTFFPAAGRAINFRLNRLGEKKGLKIKVKPRRRAWVAIILLNPMMMTSHFFVFIFNLRKFPLRRQIRFFIPFHSSVGCWSHLSPSFTRLEADILEMGCSVGYGKDLPRGGRERERIGPPWR